jgi:pimeloyl-ACP methyl ester carboxylesterase
MASYVLVHGSWQGGWIWNPVAAKLRAAGHDVYTPTLDGCAERAYTIRPEITLDTQGKEIADFMFFNDLTDVILVGTSSGGMVVLRAAELAPDRIRRLVFIDALAPMPGETVAEINGRAPQPATALAYGLAPEERAEKAFVGVPPELRAWALPRYTLHPRAPTEDRVDLHEFWARKWQVDVMNCLRAPNPPGAHQKRTADKLGGTYTELDAGHYPMLSHIDEVSSYLLKMA